MIFDFRKIEGLWAVKAENTKEFRELLSLYVEFLNHITLSDNIKIDVEYTIYNELSIGMDESTGIRKTNYRCTHISKFEDSKNNIQIYSVKEIVYLITRTNKNLFKQNKDEIRTENQTGESRTEGKRISCEKVKITSGCRPIGTPTTNIRKRTRIRNIEISARRIQFDENCRNTNAIGGLTESGEDDDSYTF